MQRNINYLVYSINWISIKKATNCTLLTIGFEVSNQDVCLRDDQWRLIMRTRESSIVKCLNIFFEGIHENSPLKLIIELITLTFQYDGHSVHVRRAILNGTSVQVDIFGRFVDDKLCLDTFFSLFNTTNDVIFLNDDSVERRSLVTCPFHIQRCTKFFQGPSPRSNRIIPSKNTLIS